MAAKQSALAGKSLGQARAQAQQQRLIPASSTAKLSQLLPSPENAREQLRNIPGLAATIASDGLGTALTVVPAVVYVAQYPQHAEHVNSSGRPYVVIHGHRRLAAAGLLGLESVPILVRSEVISIRAAAIMENLQRESLTPLEEAREFMALMDEAGLSQRSLVKRLGLEHGTRISQTYVSQRLALLRLIPVLQQAVIDEWTKEKPGLSLKPAAEVISKLIPGLQESFANGTLSFEQATVLSKMAPEEQLNPPQPPAPEPVAMVEPVLAQPAGSDCAAITPPPAGGHAGIPASRDPQPGLVPTGAAVAEPAAAVSAGYSPAPAPTASAAQPRFAPPQPVAQQPAPQSIAQPAPVSTGAAADDYPGYIRLGSPEDIVQALVERLTVRELDEVRVLLG